MRRWFFRTQKEKRQDEIRRLEKKRDKQIARECKYYSELIPKVLANCGIDHKLRSAERGNLLEQRVLGITNRQQVKILETRYNQFAIYLWVDPRELPYRSELADLHTDSVLETLTHACGRQVAWKAQDPTKGAWYVIWRNGAINAIPVMFDYSTAFDQIPANAGPLYFIVGVAENNTLIRGDLAKMPHYLVAGSTFTGKSVHLNQMLCQLIERNTPDQVQFLMIDLKGGSEFAFYEGLPHLWRPIVKTPEDVIPALIDYQEEMSRRQNLFTHEHVKNIDGYNDKHRDEKLPYIVLVFDELAQILKNPDRKMAKEAEARLGGILATSRSSGGHCVISTQKPSSDVITPYIKTNASTRICFAVPSNSDSIVVIDKGLAAGLEPAGRAIFSAGPHLTELQSPYITDNHIEKIVNAAIERGGGIAWVRPDEITLMDVIEESINNYGGKLHTDKLYKTFAGKIPRAQLDNLIASIIGKTITFQGRSYEAVQKGTGRHGGRFLRPLDQPTDAAAFGERRGFTLVLPRITPRPERSILKPGSDSEARKIS